jgi:hypothetical protein
LANPTLAGQGGRVGAGAAAGAAGDGEPEKREQSHATGAATEIKGWHSNRSDHEFQPN